MAATGLRAVPWKLVLELATLVLNRFRDDVPAGDRRKLSALVRKSKGDPRRLTTAERRELVRIVRQVDVAKLGRDVATTLVRLEQIHRVTDATLNESTRSEGAEGGGCNGYTFSAVLTMEAVVPVEPPTGHTSVPAKLGGGS